MNTGGVYLVVSAFPGKKTWGIVKAHVLARRCVVCERTQGDENTEATFRGKIKSGACPRCDARRRMRMLTMSETAAGRYIDALTRRGKFVSRKMLTRIKDNSIYRLVADELARRT